MALPTREIRPSSTHQGAGISPSHQKACSSLLDQPHPPGTDIRNKKNYGPAACGPQTYEVRQNEAEDYVSEEGTI